MDYFNNEQINVSYKAAAECEYNSTSCANIVHKVLSCMLRILTLCLVHTLQLTKYFEIDVHSVS